MGKITLFILYWSTQPDVWIKLETPKGTVPIQTSTFFSTNINVLVIIA